MQLYPDFPLLHFRHVNDRTSQTVGCIFQFSFFPKNATLEFAISISTRRNMILMTLWFSHPIVPQYRQVEVCDRRFLRRTIWYTFLASSSSPRRCSNWAWAAQWSTEFCATETKDLDSFRELWSHHDSFLIWRCRKNCIETWLCRQITSHRSSQFNAASVVIDLGCANQGMIATPTV